MATAKNGYYLTDGTRVPSVTTVIGNCKLGGIDALLAWANREGLAGRDFKETRQAAADAGTCAHERVYCHTHGRECDRSKYPAAVWERSQGPFNAFLEWADQSKLQVAAGEVPLISETHKFGGTLDCITVNGKAALGDYKTSSGIYVDHLMQVAAYGLLWEENEPAIPLDGGYHIFRFTKQDQPDDPVSFVHHWWSDLAIPLRAFLLCRELYELNKTMRRMT